MFKLHDIRYILLAHALLLFLIRPIYTLYYGENFITGNVVFNYYIVSAVFGFFAILTLLFQIKTLNIDIIGPDSISLKVGFVRYLAAFLVWITLLYFSLDEKIVGDLFSAISGAQIDYIHSNQTFIPNSLTAIGSVFILTLPHLKSRLYIKILVGCLVSAVLFVAGFISGSKTLTFYPVFVMALMWSIRRGGIKYIYISCMIAFYISFQIFMDAYRHFGSKQDFITLLQLTFSDESSNIIRDFVSRYYGTDIFYRIYMYHTFTGNNFLYGSSIFSLIIIAIPRALWPDKPIISFGKIVSENYLDNTFWGTGISAAPTWIGELYANFGYVCVPLYVASVWLILRHIKLCIVHTAPAWRRQFYFPIAFTTLGFFQEASIAGWIAQLGVIAALCMFFAALMFGKRAISPYP